VQVGRRKAPLGGVFHFDGLDLHADKSELRASLKTDL
jgi:hypothetical protein